MKLVSEALRFGRCGELEIGIRKFEIEKTFNRQKLKHSTWIAENLLRAQASLLLVLLF